MLANLLLILPGRLTGRLAPSARKEIRSWTKNNATLRALRYGKFRRFLIWSTDHPVIFTALVGIMSTAITCLVAGPHHLFSWTLPIPQLKADFDISAFAGVPWGVQATLVALVYPIVLSFIGITLQRNTKSTAMLRVYVLDSAVIPAGASSIGLLIVIGGQYFLTPYVPADAPGTYLAPLLVFNGVWLLSNLLLTGVFLARTIRFIQDAEQRHAYKRSAVDIALKSELIAALKQHIYLTTPVSKWGFPEYDFKSEGKPQVVMFALSKTRIEVSRDMSTSVVVRDVHLGLLKFVANRWCHRACKAGAKSPTLTFPVRVGMPISGEITLCSVEDGPSLNFVEKALVHCAFVFRNSTQGKLSLTSKGMLDEVGSEVEAAAENHRFSAAEEELQRLLDLHKTLLSACAIASSDNASLINISPYSWGTTTFDVEWLKPYRDIAGTAISNLEEDIRLFRQLATIPAKITANLSPRPAKLSIDAQMAGLTLAYRLGSWWTQKADASLTPAVTMYTGLLPAPASRVYEEALMAFIGSWGHVRVFIPDLSRVGEDEAWEILAARAHIYTAHIENSAFMYLKGVSRGDEAASSWFLDAFLKWWGDRRYELDIPNQFPSLATDFRMRHVTLTLADKRWENAKERLWDGNEPISLEFGTWALNLAVQRYWESVRLYLLLVLIHNAGTNPKSGSREMKHAAHTVLGKALKPGNEVVAEPLASVDQILCDVLNLVFGVATTIGRLDGFAERIDNKNDDPVVSGWTYMWTGIPNELATLTEPLCVVLTALATSPKQQSVRKSKELIESWWKDVNKLDLVWHHLNNIRSVLLGDTFNAAEPAVLQLMTLLGNTHTFDAGRAAIAQAVEVLMGTARHEKETTLSAIPVSHSKVNEMIANLAQFIFDASDLTPPFKEFVVIPASIGSIHRIQIRDGKEHYLEGLPGNPSPSYAESHGHHIRDWLLNQSLTAFIISNAISPLNTPAQRRDYDMTEVDAQSFVLDVARQCDALHAAGERPVVLVGASAISECLRPFGWGSEDWQRTPPPGVEFSQQGFSIFINGTPIYSLTTPNGDCYVLAADAIERLKITGTNPVNAVKAAVSSSEEELEFIISVQCGF